VACLEDGVQLVEALQASHSLASLAGEGVVAGGEVDRELITLSDQGSYTDPGVVLATLFQRIDNLDRVDLVILVVVHQSPSIFDVHQHFKTTSIDDVHPHHLSSSSLYFTHWINLLSFSCGNSYLIIVIFFTLTQFLEKKIYTKKNA